MTKQKAKHPYTRPEWFPGGEKASARMLGRAVPRIREATRGATDPSVTAIAKKTRSPYRVLVSTVISARTKDEVTAVASKQLFLRVDNPGDMAKLPESEIAKLIYPAGFYKTKARAIRALSKQLVEDFDGEVPETIEELLQFPGVGRKTANLVVTLAFGNPGICVDTHVHRIVNRIGAVRTKNPEETEFALRRVLLKRHWIEINDLLVMYGKEVCTPVSPRCSICVLTALCCRVGVVRSR
jgi:endonuclease-3